MTSILVSAPDLRPSLLSVLQGLANLNLIGRIATTVSLAPELTRKVACVPWMGSHLAPLLQRRERPPYLNDLVDNIWTGEVLRNLSARIAGDTVTDSVFHWAIDRFDRTVARRYAGKFPCVYGMDFSSAATFAAQKAKDGRCIQRQVSAHFSSFEAVLRRETQRFPELITEHHRAILRTADAHKQRRAIEQNLADLIIANSDYVRTTFIENGIAASKIVAVPTGCPPIDPIGARRGRGDEPVRFIYAGRLSLRKGFHYLIRAWALANLRDSAELWVAGGAEVDMSREMRLHPNICYVGPLNAQALAALYRQADVMVLPTLSEGLSHAVLEALSFGMPVITTAASGVGSLVTHGENGFIVPEADVEALAHALDAAVSQRNALAQMGQLAKERAEGWTVADSNARHALIIGEFLKQDAR